MIQDTILSFDETMDEQEPAPAPALGVWAPMYYRIYQTLSASQPASFSQNCSQCVGTHRVGRWEQLDLEPHVH